MTIDPYCNVRAIKKQRQNVLPERKDVDRRMIKNVRIRVRRKS